MEARVEKEAVKSVAKYFAHTATLPDLPDGKPDPDQGHWQLLSTHLCNVAQLAKEFAPDYIGPFRDGTASTRPRTTSSRLYWNWCSTNSNQSAQIDHAMKPYEIALEIAGPCAMCSFCL